MLKSNEIPNIELEPWTGPAIILVDLDAFFASVEQLDHPEWRGKPVIVGGDADKHGVVSTCSYEARQFGVRSAMPSSTAKRLCPGAIWTHGNFDRYREMSEKIMDIIRSETPHVQQVSIDEAFADITPTRINKEHPVSVAGRIQQNVAKLGVTCSIGLGKSKSVAKIASDIDKPSGLTVVFPGCEESFLSGLPVKVVSGIGPVAQESLKFHGINTLFDLAHADDTVLSKIFGKNAKIMRDRCTGEDISPVEVDNSVKSVSHEITFAKDLTQKDDIEAAISVLATKVGRRLRQKKLSGTTIHLKVRFDDRTLHTAQTRLPISTNDDLAMYPYLVNLLDKVWRPGIKVRLLGVCVSGFSEGVGVQECLFDVNDIEADSKQNKVREPLIIDAQKRRKLIDATDSLKDKFGEKAVILGSELKNKGNTTGSSSKNPANT